MPISGYFDTIFGSSGDLTPVPDAVQMDGAVSFTQGYGSDYELPVGNPARLVIDRAQANQLWYYVTSALQQYQQKGVPPFITTTMNGGTPFSYSQGDRVVSSGTVYTSLVNSNTTTPPGASWGTGASVPLGGTGVTSLTAYAPLFGGTTSTTSIQSGTVGTTTQVLTSNGPGAIATFQALPDATTSAKGVSLLAANSDVTTGTSTTLIPPISSLLYHRGVSKAWVKFSGLGSVSILKSYNVSSVSYLSTGKYTINFTNSFTSADYVGVGNSLRVNTSQAGLMTVGPASDVGATSSSFTILVAQLNGTATDSGAVYMDFFGDI